VRLVARFSMREPESRTSVVAELGEYFEPPRLTLRGRRPVRADRRLRADKKRIRTQSAILYEPPIVVWG
jgi:hypothetical protein